MAELSLEEVYGAPAEDVVRVTPKDNKPKREVLSVEDAYRTPIGEPLDEVDNLKMLAGDIFSRLGKAVPAVADMIFGAPGQLVGIGADAGARAYALGAGEDRRTQGLAGEAARELVPDWATAPLQTLLKHHLGMEPADQKIVNQAMDSLGAGLEKATNGMIQKEDAASLINTFMGAGIASMGKGIGEKISERVGPKYSTTELPPGEEDVVRVTPDDNKPGPTSPAAVEITLPKQVTELFKKAKANRLDPDAMTAQEAQQLADMFDRARARRPADATAAEPLPPEINESLMKLSRGEKLSADESAALDEVKSKANAAWAAKNKGAIDPKLVQMLAAFSVGAAVSAPGIFAILRHFRDKQKEDQNNDDWYKGRIYKNVAQDMTPLALAAGAFGAIKGKGGMWHPEAIERLARPLADRIVPPELVGTTATSESVTKAGQLRQKADQVIRNYLNKHAGTEGDPLKDVEIPYKEGTKRWEEIWEDMVTQQTAATFKRAGDKAFEKVPDQEAVWGLPEMGKPNAANNPLPRPVLDYLSHVGDYLRENVPADKLSNYDLVRAVKETQRWDAEAAKKMEKAAQESSAKMPVYKDYGDGYKWVEVKGKTPEETKAALQHEGDSMGHCVGGYCDYVESGDSKIYSLRDAKGKSHVTIEVQPSRGVRLESLEEPGGKPRYSAPDNIVQIKGKQNRAPIAEYLPYVQDFVKGGKWGEVGDADNTGMFRVDKGSAAHYFTNKELAERAGVSEETAREWGRGNGPSSRENLAKLQRARDELVAEVEAKRNKGSTDPKQQGFSNQQLLTGLAALGGGAAIGALVADKKKISGALLGGLAGFLVGTRTGRDVMTSPTKYLGNLSTELGLIDPELKRNARRFELQSDQRLQRAAEEIHPFLKAVGGLSATMREQVSNALLNGDAAMVKAIPRLKAPYEKVEKVLASFRGDLQALGRFGEGVVDYFPRLVKDFDGLKEHIGQEARRGLDAILAREEASMLKKKNRGLTDVERSIIANQYLFAPDQASHLPGYAKGRNIDYVSPEMQKFYEAPADSLLRYISGATFDLETAKFFGRDLAKKKVGGKEYNDVDGSIGNLAQRLVSEGKLKDGQAADLQRMLRARFVEGQQGMDGAFAAIRNLTNLGLLGDVASAATQIGDSVMVMAYHGVVPTLQGLVQNIRGPEMKIKELGLVNHIAEELSSQGATGNALRVVLKPFFAPIDKFSKQMNLSAGLIKNRGLAQTAKGRVKLAEKWGGYFGEDFPRLLSDLQARRLTPLVEELAFGELSNVQPISRMEVPEAYLKNPNARLIYQMKTWMLKQMDVVRREVYQNIASGEMPKIRAGVKAAMGLTAAYALSNVPADVVKDWLAGRPVDPFGKGKLFENVAQTFGLNRYAMDKLAGGNLQDVVAGTVIPPAVKMLESVAKEDWNKVASYIPVFGRELYARYLGGNERREIAETAAENKEKAKGDRKPLSEAAKEFRRKQREAKREQLR